MLKCPECGKENIASARFCGGCGRPRFALLAPRFGSSTGIPPKEKISGPAITAPSIPGPVALPRKPAFAEEAACQPEEPRPRVDRDGKVAQREGIVFPNERRSNSVRRLRILKRLRIPAFAALAISSLLLLTPLLVFALGEGTSNGTGSKEPARSSFQFCDVPLDHPVYEVWERILNAGNPRRTIGPKARPFDPVTQAEWGRAMASLFPDEFATSKVFRNLGGSPDTPMDWTGIRESLIGLGSPFKGTDFPPADARDGGQKPDRIEAFALLEKCLPEEGGER